MSGINGDKSRFNRMRKHRIAQRIRNRELVKDLPQQGKAKTRPARATAKAVSV